MLPNQIPEVAQHIYQNPQHPQSHDLKKSLISLISNPHNLQQILQFLPTNLYSMLAISSVLLESISTGQYLPTIESLIQQSQNPSLDKPTSASKLSLANQLKETHYWRIILEIYKHIANADQKLKGSLEQLVSVCLFRMLSGREDVRYLEEFVRGWMGGLVVRAEFYGVHWREVVVLEGGGGGSLGIGMGMGLVDSTVRILALLVEEVTESTRYKNFSAFKKSAANFQNNFLGLILGVAVILTKNIIKTIAQQQNRLLDLSKNLLNVLKLFQTITNYPFGGGFFSSSFNQSFQFQPLMSNTCSNQISFPQYFHNIINDRELIQLIVKLHLALITPTQNTHHFPQLLTNSLQILTQLSKASKLLFFISLEQRLQWRRLCVEICVNFMRSYETFEGYYTECLVEMATSIAMMYQYEDFQEGNQKFKEAATYFAYNVVKNCPFELSQGNVVSKAFGLMMKLYEEVPRVGELEQGELLDEETMSSQQQVNYYSQARQAFIKILQVYHDKMINFQYIQHLFTQHRFQDQQCQITTFKQLFKPICFAFDMNCKQNFKGLESLPIDQFPSYTQSLWTHYITSMLFEPRCYEMSPCARVVQKLLAFTNVRRTVSDMRFLSEFLRNLLEEMDYGVSKSPLWILMKAENQKLSFQQLLETSIAKCIDNFNYHDEALIDCSLTILRDIYKKLQQAQHQQQSSKLIKHYQSFFLEFLSSLESSQFSKPYFYRKRVMLFQTVSVVLLHNGEVDSYYRVYNRVRAALENTQVDNLLKYLYDVTGIVKSLTEGWVLRMMMELVLGDLGRINAVYLGDRGEVLGDERVRKAFLNLFYAMLEDHSCHQHHQSTTSSLSSPIPTLLAPIWQTLLLCSHYQYGRLVLIVWRLLIQSNPISTLPPLPNPLLCKPKAQTYYKQLVQRYFDNILRVSNMEQLYGEIGDRIDNLLFWWEAVVDRGLKVERVEGVEGLLRARVWREEKQMRLLARVAYISGKYEERVRVYPELYELGEEEGYVRGFMQRQNYN